MFRTLSSLLIPIVILAVAIFLYSRLGELPSSQLVMIKLLPIAIALISMGLCLRFNRSLVFFATLSLV
ncbi:MAG: hypothetical protein KAJ92_05880, partial [Gammaproteobacteria bacterium]|nr:hypothetical protein [Gammaproteobacteria bacterium]